MGKGNLIQGMGRGKLGDTVFYRSQGEQMFRVRNRNPKNPKSQAQMIQRSIMATVVQAYSYMSTIVDHSFESIQYGVKSMNYFNKVNADRLRSLYGQDVQEQNNGIDAKARVTAPKVTAFIANNYIVAKGSLENPVNVTITNPNTQNAVIRARILGLLTNSTIGEIFKIIGLTKTESMLTELSINYTNKSPLYAYNGETQTPGASIPFLKFEVSRIVRNSTILAAEDAAKKIGDTAGEGVMTYDEIWAKYFNTENSDRETFNMIEESITGEGVIFDKDETAGVAYILSEKVGTIWKRSNAEMTILPQDNLGLDANYGMLAWTAGTTEIGESEWYLNKGDLIGSIKDSVIEKP